MRVIDRGELTHWGIKGMRWGVRRTPEQLGHKTKRKDIKAEREAVSKQVREEFRIDQKYREADDKYRQSVIKRGKTGAGSRAYYQKDAKKAEREANLEIYNRMVQKYGDDYKRLLDAEERGEKNSQIFYSNRIDSNSISLLEGERMVERIQRKRLC